MTVLLNSYRFGGGFSASTVPNLRLWLKADSLSLNDNDTIQTWGDSSGNARDATQLTSANRPVYKTGILNGMPVVRFDGATKFMTVADVPELDMGTGEGITVFIVGINNASGTQRSFVAKRDGSNDGYNVIHSAGNKPQFNVDIGTVSNVTGTTTITGLWRIWTAQRDSNGTTSRIRVSGISENNIETPGTSQNTVDYHIGCLLSAGSPSGFLDGDIAEILHYEAGLSNTDLNTVGNYLANKYNLTWNDQ